MPGVVVARRRRQCPRAGIAGARDGAGSGPSARDRAGGLGACSARRLSFHIRSHWQERARSLELAHRAQAAVRRRHRAGRARQRADAARRVRCRRSGHRARRSAIDGGSAWAWSRSGWIDVYKGDPAIRDRALQDRARPGAARSAGLQQHGRDRLRAFQGRPIRRSVHAGRSGRWPSILRQAGCIERCARPHVLAGQGPQARAASDALRQHYPDLTVSEVQRGMPPLPPSQCDLVVGALQEAGLPA